MDDYGVLRRTMDQFHPKTIKYTQQAPNRYQISIWSAADPMHKRNNNLEVKNEFYTAGKLKYN